MTGREVSDVSVHILVLGHNFVDVGLPGTSLSAIESLPTKAGTAVNAAARSAALKAARAADVAKVKEWLAAVVPVDDAFMKLKLNGAGDDLFKEPNLAMWLHYAEKFDGATRAQTNSVISTLLPRYTTAKFGGPRMQDMTHNLLVKWATEGVSIRQFPIGCTTSGTPLISLHRHHCPLLLHSHHRYLRLLRCCNSSQAPFGEEVIHNGPEHTRSVVAIFGTSIDEVEQSGRHNRGVDTYDGCFLALGV